MEKQLSLAAQKATCVYYTALHNHSFKSMDFTTIIMRKLFNDKFTYSRTKCRAIITNVIALFATKQILQELKEDRFISVLIDSSNHLDETLVPLIVRYFHTEKGVMVEVLELVNFGGETSDLLLSCVSEMLQKLDLLEKVLTILTDNTNTNFVGKKKKGKNNLYYKLQEKTLNLIGIGYPAHVVHNAVQTAVDCLPIDLQLIINKIYQHFHIYSVQV
jgi:transcription initiation factor IIE alpha subunit